VPVGKIDGQPDCRREQHSQNYRRRQLAHIFKPLIRLRFRKKDSAKKFHHTCKLRQLPAYASFETLNFCDDWETI
jgi:hypothetical protein